MVLLEIEGNLNERKEELPSKEYNRNQFLHH